MPFPFREPIDANLGASGYLKNGTLAVPLAILPCFFGTNCVAIPGALMPLRGRNAKRAGSSSFLQLLAIFHFPFSPRTYWDRYCREMAEMESEMIYFRLVRPPGTGTIKTWPKWKMENERWKMENAFPVLFPSYSPDVFHSLMRRIRSRTLSAVGPVGAYFR